MEFESQKVIEEQIMATVKDGNINMIGICGMGGVGKTTMVKRIRKWPTEMKLFDEVVMVVVSQKPDPKKDTMRSCRIVTYDTQRRNFAVRADWLDARINKVKRFLIILDDVWEMLNLETL